MLNWKSLAVLPLLVMAVPAAAIATLTFTGTVANGTGPNRAFGLPNNSLAGLTFRARFTYDNSVGNHLLAPTFETVFGGTLRDVASPAVRTTIRINNRVIVIRGGGLDAYNTGNNGNAGGVGAQSSYISPDEFSFRSILSNRVSTTGPSSIGPSLTRPFTYIVRPGDDLAGNALSYSDGFVTIGGFLSQNRLDLNLRPTAVALTVPEPGTWTLMITGFGLVGLMRRRGAANSKLLTARP